MIGQVGFSCMTSSSNANDTQIRCAAGSRKKKDRATQQLNNTTKTKQNKTKQNRKNMEIHEGISIVLIGGLLMFLLAFSIGANDVGNSIGPVVGASVLSLTHAITMDSFFVSGRALLLGARVS